MTRRRGLWLLLALLVLTVALLATAAVVLLPRYARQVAVWQLRSLTGRPVAIQALDLSLATGEFSVRGLRVTDRDGGLLAEFDRLEGRFHRRSLLRLHFWIESLTLINGHVRVVRVGPGRFNISDLLDRPASGRRLLDVSVDRFAIAGGWVALEDRVLTPARTWRSDDIRLDARDVTTLAPRGTAVGSTTIAGALITVRVQDLQLAPVHLRASVNVRDVDLRLPALYLPADGPVAIERGTVDAAFNVVVDAREGTTLDADAVIERLAVRRRGFSGDAVTAPEVRLMIRELRQRPGSIALRYASVGGDLTVFDPTTTPPRPLTFSDLTVTASGIEQPATGLAQIAMHANVPGGGEVDIGGTAGLAPRRADVRVRARGIELASLARYLPMQGRLAGIGTADVRVVATVEKTLGLTVTGDARLDRLTLGDGSRSLVGAARVAATGLAYTWPARVAMAQLTVTQPSATVERDVAGAIGLVALLRPPSEPATSDANPAATPSAASAPTPDIRIGQLKIDDGRATLSDAASASRVEVKGLAVSARNVTWPGSGPADLELSASVAGAAVTARGTLDGGQQRGEIAVTLRGADLAALQPWLPIVGRVRGAADADVTASIDLAPFTLTLRGSLGVADLAFLDGTRPLLTVARVDAGGIDLQWPASLAIDRLRVNTPWAQVERNLQGELSLRALFGRRPDRPAPPTTEPVAAGPVPGLELSVREALFDNGGLNIVDDAVEPAARFELRGSRLELRNLTWPARGPAAVQLSTPMPGSGTLKARGTLSIEPTRLQLEAELDQVDLGPGRPYLPFDARLNGKVTGRAKISGTFGDAITLVVDGDATVDRLALGDADRRLATAQRAELTGLRYQYPTSVRIRQVALRKPWALIERNADGSLELVSLFTRRRQPPPSASGTGGPAPAPTPTPASRVRVAINKLSLDDGFLRFVDRTTTPDYAEELAGILLTAEGLGTNPRRHGSLDLRGRFASGNALTVRGQVGGFTGPQFLDLTVDVKEFPVPRLNPYLDRLSTWVARQGTLTASLRYRLDDDDLQASNDITLNGLELEEGGRGNEVQRQVGLPLGLLVSLLKDRQGNIHLDIPVRGRLSAPDFDYSQAMWTAVRNLAIKLVSLPFSWVGNMFYTADARIDSVQVFPVPFEIAKAAPTSSGRDQLQRLATFLKEQPAIRLRLRPVTTVADVTALRREALNARLAELGTDAAARRQAAVALYAELFPRRQPPASDEALFEELVRETPPPPRALRALATERTATVRDGLIRGGVAPERLEPAESRAAVEREGDGRVEFEIAS